MLLDISLSERVHTRSKATTMNPETWI